MPGRERHCSITTIIKACSFEKGKQRPLSEMRGSPILMRRDLNTICSITFVIKVLNLHKISLMFLAFQRSGSRPTTHYTGCGERMKYRSDSTRFPILKFSEELFGLVLGCFR